MATRPIVALFTQLLHWIIHTRLPQFLETRNLKLQFPQIKAVSENALNVLKSIELQFPQLKTVSQNALNVLKSIVKCPEESTSRT